MALPVLDFENLPYDPATPHIVTAIDRIEARFALQSHAVAFAATQSYYRYHDTTPKLSVPEGAVVIAWFDEQGDGQVARRDTYDRDRWQIAGSADTYRLEDLPGVEPTAEFRVIGKG